MHGHLTDHDTGVDREVIAEAPSHEEIALRAFELYEQRGDTDGSDLGDWLEAERQLLHDRARALEGFAPARQSD